MLTEKQASNMLQLQASMNSKINPNWIHAGYQFLRAAMMEGVEAIDHHGWKWWKAQTCDLEQLQMELVDIWHFMLSHMIIENGGEVDRAKSFLTNRDESAVVFDGVEYSIESLDLLQKLELLVGLSVARRINLALFEAILFECALSWDELYVQYVGKNVLNFFRQDHGYKTGEYVKIWKGREDNEHLVEILSAIDHSADSFQTDLYNELKSRYDLITA